VRAKDLSGNRYGRWTVLSFGGIFKNRYLWICKCDCGVTKFVSGSSLSNGTSKSCGCAVRKHGDSRGLGPKTEYNAWWQMKSRCYNKNAGAYKRYGGRGISVCDRWIHSYESFLADMGRKPSPIHSIDRIDNNGNYEPTNCRWATPVEQSANTRRNIMLSYNGVTKPLGAFAREYGLNYATLAHRIKHLKMNVEEALTKVPIIGGYHAHKTL
jgi:hypothetical protein